MRTTIPKTICLEDRVMARARHNALRKNRSFSSYITDLILRDSEKLNGRKLSRPALVKAGISLENHQALRKIADERNVPLATLLREALREHLSSRIGITTHTAFQGGL